MSKPDHRRHIPQPGLGQRTAYGVAWALLQTVCSKATSILGQIILAWLLIPEDFGLIGLAYTVTTFATLIQTAGIREVLIHRSRRIQSWSTPAFWMSLVFGGAATVAMLVAAPLAALAYGEPKLVELIGILAIAAPITSASMVPQAALESQLRFGLLAKIGVLERAGQVLSTIALAAMGFGAFSFVLPRPLIAALRLVAMWWIARPKVSINPQFSRWRYLIGDSAMMFGGSVLIAVISQGDYIILGALFSASVVGLYFFAFNLSMQTVQVLTKSLSRVLFPALARIKGSTNRTRAFLNACGIISLVGTPFALLQVIVADPTVHLLFDDRWIESIPLIQVLSLATAFRVVLAAGSSLLQAQGIFRYRLILYSISAPIFLLCVYVGASTNGAIGAAAGVTAYYMILGIFLLWLVIRPGGGRLVDAWKVFAMPLFIAAMAAGAGWLAAQWIPDWHATNLLRIITSTAVSLGIYAACARLFLRERTDELIRRLTALWNNRKAHAEIAVDDSTALRSKQ